MGKVKFFGTFFDNSGYSSHCRSFVNELAKQIGAENIDLQTQLVQCWERLVNDNELKMIQNNFGRDCTYIFVGQPQFWPLILSERPEKFVGCVVWEGDKVPDYWNEYLYDDRVSQIWVPSTHVKNAILNSYYYGDEIKSWDKYVDKIKIVPHGVNLKTFFPDIKNRQEKYTFIAAKGWSKGENDRGGIQYLLKAFDEEFKKDEPVQLLVHINSTYCPPNWSLAEELSKLKIDTSNINITTTQYTKGQMAKFYNLGDAFITTSMAEGFNLPLAEAMACGLTPIYTNFGGHLDFCEEIGYPIDYILIDSLEQFYEGIKWAKPLHEDIKKQMRACYENKTNIKISMKDFSWKKSVKKALEFLK